MAPYFHATDSGRIVNRGKPGEKIYRHRFIMTGRAQRRGEWSAVLAWLSEEVGPGGELWVSNSLGDVHMCDDAAAFAFKMRWC